MRVESPRRAPATWRLRPICQAALLVQGGLLAAGLLVALLASGAAAVALPALLVAASLNLLVVVLFLRRQPAADGAGQAPDVDPEPPRSTRDSAAIQSIGDLVPAGDESLRRRLQGLEQDLAQRERRLDRLMAGRERAREESRLKSDYLTLLGRELQPLMTRLDEVAEREGYPASPEEGQRLVRELRERLGDLSVLLAGLSGGETEAAAPRLRPARVLIVDDGPVNLMLARQVLERQGLEVVTATSGAEALACLARAPFDLVLMDIFMPDMDGMETSRRWREEEASRYPGRRCVLVALTANASDDDRRRFEDAGLDDYLAKPYRPQALVDRVRHWLPDAVDGHEAP
ncbi:CheY-like chemotaxis protein [Halomonas campaniensis]|uniref:CheY-like chemotaxis protein n=1 Tax=Halomonas campaniensis TaxID=213554 RepID=A0A7W5K5S6_9GAMM|nr:response regulator [Halomonas campaniensis]MBB3332427.1 CheY-like chemotaxis protein [Halomonas campaniensis]